MNGSIYDFSLERVAFQPHLPAFTSRSASVATASVERGASRVARSVGLILNPRSHRNNGNVSPWSRHPNVIGRAPKTRAELRDVLTMFATRGIDVLAIDGGDGTVRDVLTCAGDVWHTTWPDILLLPTGKTNALAGDLGIPAHRSLEDGLAAVARGHVATRAPMEIAPAVEPGATVRGFILGAGAFVDATALAQRTHRAGAFNGVAVSLALGWGVIQTLFGGSQTSWRKGSRIGLDYDTSAERMHESRPDGVRDRYLLFASTLHRLPVGLKPFGVPRGGLKTLVIDAPPRRLPTMIAPLLTGSQSLRLEQRGYHRVDAVSVEIDIATNFVLDGETFPPGAYVLRKGAPLRFIVT